MDQHNGSGSGQPLPYIIIYGLKQREDRWKRCKEIMREESFTAECYSVDPNYRDLHRQSTKDFLEMLRKHQKELLFFENDFELVDGWREVFDQARGELPVNYDMLYLGGNLTTAPTRVSENLLKVNGSWMMHAVMMSKRFIMEILRTYNPNQHWVFDEWCRKVATGRKFYMCYPMISYQREGFSDYAGAYTKYDIFNNQYYRKI